MKNKKTREALLLMLEELERRVQKELEPLLEKPEAQWTPEEKERAAACMEDIDRAHWELLKNGEEDYETFKRNTQN